MDRESEASSAALIGARAGRALRRPENWKGESGYVTNEILARYLPEVRERDTLEVFMCGPQPLMNATEQALAQLGVFIGNIHAERFDLV